MGLTQVKAAAAAAENFLHRAAEVDVDGVETRLDEFLRTGGELLRLCAHQLPADRPLFVRNVQEMPVAIAVLFHRHEKLVEHYFAHGIRRSVPTSEQPHRPVAIARQRRLHDWKADCEGTELEGR